MGRTETRREISVTLWRRFSAWIPTQGSKEESCENAGPEARQPPGSGAECSTAGRARPASRKARREHLMAALLTAQGYQMWSVFSFPWRRECEIPELATIRLARALLEPSTDVRDRKSTRLNSSHGYISYAV